MSRNNRETKVKISEVIAELEQMKKEHGDVEALVRTEFYGSIYDCEQIEFLPSGTNAFGQNYPAAVIVSS